MTGTVGRHLVAGSGNATERAKLDQLQLMILALARELGRPPSAAEIQMMLRARGLGSAQLAQLLDAVGEASVSPRERGDWPAQSDSGSFQASAVAASSAATESGQPPDSQTVHSPNGASLDKLVQRAVEDLLDDWHRAGGHLSFEDVTRLSTKRVMDSAQLAAVLVALRDHGVDIDDVGDEAPSDDMTDMDASELDRPSSRDIDIVGAYLRDIRRYPLLNAAQEVALGRQIRAGLDANSTLADPTALGSIAPALVVELRRAVEAGRAAHQQLVRSNLRLVVNFAKSGKYRYSGVEFIDRIQDGNIGLMRAADKFDATLGYKFSTYASWWIRQFIERGLADRGSLIRLPVHVHEKLQRVLRARAVLEHRLDRSPTLNELAHAADMESGHVRAMLDYGRMVLSLDAPVGHEGGSTLSDYLAEAPEFAADDPYQQVAEALLREQVWAMLDQLGPREAFVLEQRFGLKDDHDRTLQEIGEAMGVTRERVRQLQSKALEKLRQPRFASAIAEWAPVTRSTSATDDEAFPTEDCEPVDV
jgi:RNA polymerase primary sigma factor